MGNCGELCIFAESLIYKVYMERFLGNMEAKMDAKGRVFVPSPFRKLLSQGEQSKLILRRDIYQPCLVLYPEAIWNTELDALKSKLNAWNPQHQMILRQFMAEVEILSLDSNGRILIPKRLIIAAKLEESIRFLGMDTVIELWNAQQTESAFIASEIMMQQVETILGKEELL